VQANLARPHGRRILVVEDDAAIGVALEQALQEHGFEVALHTRGGAVASFVDDHAPDLVLLDAGLPDTDGFTLCRMLRSKHPDLSIILVTARDADIDIVVGLDAGANDYVTKPFSMSVLLARVRAQLRTTDVVGPDDPITLGDLRIDPAGYVASIAGTPMDLRPREFQLLLYLVREAGRVVTRDRLLADIWDLHWESSTKTVDMHIVAVRRKLGTSIEIVTVRGVGYRLVAP
jgi:DNA-binding response OmpR family regulator